MAHYASFCSIYRHHLRMQCKTNGILTIRTQYTYKYILVVMVELLSGRFACVVSQNWVSSFLILITDGFFVSFCLSSTFLFSAVASVKEMEINPQYNWPVLWGAHIKLCNNIFRRFFHRFIAMTENKSNSAKIQLLFAQHDGKPDRRPKKERKIKTDGFSFSPIFFITFGRLTTANEMYRILLFYYIHSSSFCKGKKKAADRIRYFKHIFAS